MHNAAILGGAAMVAFSMIPSCPAPIGVAIALAAPLAGGLTYIGIQSNTSPYGYGSGLRKRGNAARVNGYPGVSQEVWDQCQNSNNGAKIKVTQTAKNSKSNPKQYVLSFSLTVSIGFRLDGVTPECMNLAALFTEGGSVYPCGSACLQYENLSDANTKRLKETIQNLLE